MPLVVGLSRFPFVVSLSNDVLCGNAPTLVIPAKAGIHVLVIPAQAGTQGL